MLYLLDNNQADVVEAFNSTSRYLDDLLNINDLLFRTKVVQIYPQIRQIPLILKSPFWSLTCPKRMT